MKKGKSDPCQQMPARAYNALDQVKSFHVAVVVTFSSHFSKQLQTTSRRTVRHNRPWGLHSWWKPPTTKVAIVLWYTTFSASGYTLKLALTCRFSEAFFPHGDSPSSTNVPYCQMAIMMLQQYLMCLLSIISFSIAVICGCLTHMIVIYHFY